MIDSITKIITLRGLLIIAGFLVVVDIGQCSALKIQGARLGTAIAEKQTLTVQLKETGNQVKAQNGAIDQMLDNAAKAADRLHAAEAEAGKVQVITRERIQYVQEAAIPVECPEAVTWGAGHAIQIGKRWEVTP